MVTLIDGERYNLDWWKWGGSEVRENVYEEETLSLNLNEDWGAARGSQGKAVK
jgi:hypothetical protein